MRSRRLAPLVLLLPLALLTACAGVTPELTIAPNWYPSPNNPNPLAAKETLVYSVTSKEIEKIEGALYAAYDGTYTTNLTYTSYNGAPAYLFSADLVAEVVYSGSSEATVTETVHSDVWFALETDASPLRPYYSKRTVESVVPDLTANGYPLTKYNYSFEVKYDWDTSKAAVTFTNHLLSSSVDEFRPDASPSGSAEIDLRGEGTYLDNEQVLFAMRGLTLANGVSFRTVNPVKDKVWRCAAAGTLGTPQSVEYDAKFIRNGTETEQTVDAHKIALGYADGNTGTTKTYIYADRVGGENLYRNVLLEMEEPLIGGLGTLVYKLTKADFIV